MMSAQPQRTGPGVRVRCLNADENAKIAVMQAGHDATVYVTGHVNRDGSFRGGTFYNADTVLELSRRGDEVVVTATKNRYGPAPVELASFRIDATGRWTPQETP